MAIFIHSGPITVEYFRKRASVAISANSILGFTGTGGTVEAIATASPILAGVSLRAVVSGDSDYASNTPIPVIVPKSDTVFLCDVTTGTLTASSEGDRFDLTDASGINQSASSRGVVTCVKFLTSTLGLFKLNGVYEFKNGA